MAVWANLSSLLSHTAGEALSGVAERLRTVFGGDPETRRQVSFSVAMIALSAKMAKADGIVTVDEVDAFREIFQIPEKEAASVARLYNFAKQDVAGFQSYARQVRQLFPDEDDIMEDVMDGLFHIAKADGLVHDREMAYLDEVAQILGVDGKRYTRIRLRHVGGDSDSWQVLDADPTWSDDELRAHYRKLVQENHPDRLIARGVPPEFVAIANDRLAAINSAWERVRAERRI
jgi:DnaJ like chaperone protein